MTVISVNRQKGAIRYNLASKIYKQQ